MNPRIYLFCKPEQLQKHATLDKNPYCVDDTLNCVTPAGTSNELDVHKKWKENTNRQGAIFYYYSKSDPLRLQYTSYDVKYKSDML